MYIAPITELNTMPSLGSLIGSNASSAVIANINQQYGNQGGVIFGQPGDPYLDRYCYLMEKVNANLVSTDRIVNSVRQEILHPSEIISITTEEELRHTPVAMQLPILTYAPIRALFEEERIWGYGIEIEHLPKEDVYGRLIANDKVVFDKDLNENKEIPTCFINTWSSDDPHLSDTELTHIEETRTFLDRWLYEQMKDKMRDPTDLSSRISKTKKKR